MSRTYRRPGGTICSAPRANPKWKRYARRVARRRGNAALSNTWDVPDIWDSPGDGKARMGGPMGVYKVVPDGWPKRWRLSIGLPW